MRLAPLDGMLARLGARLEGLDARHDAATTWIAMAAVLTVAAVVFVFRLGAAELCSTNEAVEGLAVQQMVEHGALVAPELNGNEPMFKPPLFHWAATGIARTLGMHEATELTVRLPSVVFGLATVVLTMAFVRAWLGLSSALLAGLVLVGSYQFVTEARFGRVDMALTCCEFLALVTFCAWLRARSAPASQSRVRPNGMLYLLAVALALAVLAKGPVGLIVPVGAVVMALITRRRWADLRALAAPGPAVVALALGAAWYLTCWWTGRLDVLDRQLVDENFRRFLGGIETMPPLYYLRPLLLNSVPLSLLVPLTVARALRARRNRRREDDAHPADLRAYVLATFWTVTVVFFSIAAYKRRAYLLPLWPPAAALIAWWVASWRGTGDRQLAKGTLAAVCGVLAVFNLAYIPHAEHATCGGADYRAAAEAINDVVPRRTPLFESVPDAASASLLFYLRRTVRPLGVVPIGTTERYVIVPEDTWPVPQSTPPLRRVLTVSLERRRLILAERTTAQEASREQPHAAAAAVQQPDADR